MKLKNNIHEDHLMTLLLESIEQELNQFPCLGLVSKENSGSHKDMNYDLFIKSMTIFKPMFKEVLLKIDNINNFIDLQFIGLKYEKIMFELTNQINTQKGLIFCSLIFFYCFVKFKPNSFKKFKKEIKLFCKPLKEKQNFVSSSIGNTLLKSHKVKGARFEAISGYKNVFKAAKYYMNKIVNLNLSKNNKIFILLLYLTFLINDTTLFNKVGERKYYLFKKRIKLFLNKLNFKKIEDIEAEIIILNNYCIENIISPGGAADLLSLVLFLLKITKTTEV